MAQGLLTLAEYWLWAGAAVAAVFLVIGIDRIDEDARGAYVFRPLLIPGVLVIWPLVLWRWLVLETGRDRWHRRHRPMRALPWALFATVVVLVPLAAVLGVALRQTPPTDIAPVQLEAPR
ncbi:MAG: hypothetical protein AAGE76_00160 [Pseudomonadota bacterium]